MTVTASYRRIDGKETLVKLIIENSDNSWNFSKLEITPDQIPQLIEELRAYLPGQAVGTPVPTDAEAEKIAQKKRWPWNRSK